MRFNDSENRFFNEAGSSGKGVLQKLCALAITLPQADQGLYGSITCISSKPFTSLFV
jgi:hypothetical protein